MRGTVHGRPLSLAQATAPAPHQRPRGRSAPGLSAGQRWRQSTGAPAPARAAAARAPRSAPPLHCCASPGAAAPAALAAPPAPWPTQAGQQGRRQMSPAPAAWRRRAPAAACTRGEEARQAQGEDSSSGRQSSWHAGPKCSTQRARSPAHARVGEIQASQVQAADYRRQLSARATEAPAQLEAAQAAGACQAVERADGQVGVPRQVEVLRRVAGGSERCWTAREQAHCCWGRHHPLALPASLARPRHPVPQGSTGRVPGAQQSARCHPAAACAGR